MATLPARKSTSSLSAPGQSLALIVGIACLVGFFIDVLILSLPLDPLNIQWRIGLLQQMGDRSIVLLFGLALIMFGLIDQRSLRKNFALLCLGLGVMFSLSGVLVIRDSLKFQDMTLTNIASQEAEVRRQLDEVQTSPEQLNEALTPELLQQATDALDQRIELAKQNATSSLFKIGAGSVGNLIVTGLALIAIGRFGSRAGG